MKRSWCFYHFFRRDQAVAGVAQLLVVSSCGRKGVGSIPVPGIYGRQPVDVSLSFPLSLPLPLGAMKKCPQVRVKERERQREIMMMCLNDHGKDPFEILEET